MDDNWYSLQGNARIAIIKQILILVFKKIATDFAMTNELGDFDFCDELSHEIEVCRRLYI